MLAPLLPDKYRIPPERPGTVPRPRLMAQLDAGLQGKLTLVSAPAGFGKTTLVAQWARHCRGGASPPTMSEGTSPLRVAWLSLEADDNDPARFWAYAIAALRAVPGLDHVGDAPGPGAPPAEPELASLLNEIGQSPQPLSLILDDYHLITERRIHDALNFFLDHLPPQMHLAIATRSDPPWPLARRWALGEVAELRAHDLRFTPEEARAFLAAGLGYELAPEDVAALEQRTEGWATGLQIAALSVRGRHDASSFIKAFSGSHRFILDYLVEEVLERQPPAVQEFLLKTSILERMAAPLCNAVVGAEGSQARLSQLEQANLFLVPLDEERCWYRYHHLFADLLRRRLEQQEPAQVPLLCRRASAWYAQNGLIAEAVQYALAGGDRERVARLVAGNVLGLMEHAELVDLGRRVDALPDEVVLAEPWLCVARAWILAFTGRIEAVGDLLDAAEKAAAGQGGADSAHIGGYIAAIRSHMALTAGDMAQGIDQAHEALKYLPADDPATRSWAAVALVIGYHRAGQVTAEERALAQAVAASRALGAGHVAVLVACTLGAMQRQRGALNQAAATFRRALQIADDYAARAGRQLPIGAYARIYLAQLRYEWNDLEGALRDVQAGVALCERWREPELSTAAYMCLAQVLLARGDGAGALDAARKAAATARELSPWYARRVEPLEALIRLRLGDLAAAIQWAAVQESSPPGQVEVRQQWSASLVVARIRMAQGRPDEALALTEQVLGAAEAAGSALNAVASLAVQALALQAQGREQEALGALQRALEAAEPEGYVRTFVDEGAPMPRLLHEVARQGIQAGYAGRLLAAFPESAPAAARTQSESPLIEPLSDRELAVLGLLAEGLSNQEIARRLVVTLSTVKYHTGNIYGKLGVRSRTQAIARATALGLVPPAS